MPKRWLIAVCFVFCALGAWGLVFLSGYRSVPILMYHSVTEEDPGENRLAVSGQTFERQMNFLKKHHYQVVPLETLASLLGPGKRFPSRTVALTFDDGYRNNFTQAFPILKKYGLCATIFVIVDEVSRSLGDRLSWEELREMRDSGLIYFGSHAMGPEPLINIKSEQEVRRQIVESKRVLEEKLLRDIFAFSYPEGHFNSKIREWVQEAGYKIAVGTKPRPSSPRGDLFSLSRIRVSSSADNLLVFRMQLSGYYQIFKELRRKK